MIAKISQNGTFFYNIDEESFFEMEVDERISANIIMTYSGKKSDYEIVFRLQKHAQLVVLMKMQNAKDVNCQVFIMQGARMHMGIWDIDDQKLSFHLQSELLAPDAEIRIDTACNVINQKEYIIECKHISPNTNSKMQNYAIVHKKAKYQMKAIGDIQKGAYASSTNQTTHVLTLDKDHNSKVIPLLYIDENDVQASHATTLGQPNENQLYYLQSRGLTRKEALQLLSIGYLLPITKILDDEKQQELLKAEMEMKVGIHV